MLDDELNKMGPIARDLNTLYKQKDEVQSFLQRISKKHSEVATILEDSKQLINSGVVPNPRELQDTVSGLQNLCTNFNREETPETEMVMT